MILIGSQLHNLVDEYVDAYHSLISNRTPYDRLRTLTHDSEKLLELSKTLGTMLVNGSLGYVETDSDNYTRVYYHGSGFSAQFGKLYEFFNPKLDRYTGRYRKWYRYVDLKTDSAYRHKCSSGPPCFSDAQDKLDIFPSMLVRLLKKLGVIHCLGMRKTLTLFRLISNRFNRTTPKQATHILRIFIIRWDW